MRTILGAIAFATVAVMPLDELAAATVDFESPVLGDAGLELLTEFTADGVTITAPYSCTGTALGLARESTLTECAIGLPPNQMLLTGLGRLLPRAEHIRLDFTGDPVPGITFVSVDVLTAPGSTVRLRLFNSIGAELDYGVAVAVPAYGDCGEDLTLTARATVRALASDEVAWAIVDAGPPPGMQCGPTECSPCAPGFGIDNVVFRRVDASIIDFESPDLGSDARRVIDPFVTEGAVFTAPAAVGLVRECALTPCGACDDQLLGSLGPAPGSIGLGQWPIRVDFPPGLGPVTCVGAEFQTLAYTTIGLHLFDSSDGLVGTAQAPVFHAYPACGSPDEGEATARGIVHAVALEPATYAIAWIIQGWTCPFTDCNPFSISRLSFGDCTDAGPPILTVGLDLHPDTLLIGSHARYVTAYIEPDGFPPSEIDVGSLRLARTVPAEVRFAIVGDHDADGLPDLMVKFRRSELDPLLAPGVNTLELTGSSTTGAEIVGVDDVTVIAPRWRQPIPALIQDPSPLP